MEAFHLLDVTNNLSVLEVGRQECPPGHSWSLYLLDRTVIHFIESGRGTFVCGGKTYRLKKGDAFYIPVHTRGSYRADEADPWRYTWIYFKGESGSKFYEDLGLTEKTPVYTSSDSETVHEAIEQLERQSATGGGYAVMSALYSVLHAMATHNSNTATGKKKSGEEYITACRKYIASKSCEKVSVNDLCRLVKIDRTYLYRLFKAYYQTGPKEYILKTKLETAKQLLTESPLSVSEVAQMIGYEDPFAFSKQFKQHFGISPRDYGVKHKNIIYKDGDA